MKMATAIEKLKLIKKGKLSAEQNIRQFLERIKRKNGKINAVLQINNHALLQAKEVDSNIRRGRAGRLAGLAVAVKANINVKGLNASCASKTLGNYKSPYDSAVVEKLKKEGAIVIGMTNMDEFACGSSGESSAFGVCKNPFALDRIPGGSSSGSAAAVAADFCDLALGSDTGGSIRNPASHCGVVGMKPSYSAVSRYGLIDLSMSLDQIGPLAKNVEDARLLFEVIKGEDKRDATTREINENPKKTDRIVIGIPKVKADKEILEIINKKIKEVCKRKKWKQQAVQIRHTNLGIQTYYPINYVEFFSGTRRFDGRRYGLKIEDACGQEVLRRILGGKMIAQEEFAGRYYKKALDAKAVITKEFAKAFEKVGCIIMPVVPKLPHKLGARLGVEDMYNYDTLSVLANLAEIPAISVPTGKIRGIPVGLQIMCALGEDKKMLAIAREFEGKEAESFK